MWADSVKTPLLEFQPLFDKSIDRIEELNQSPKGIDMKIDPVSNAIIDISVLLGRTRQLSSEIRSLCARKKTFVVANHVRD